jgi:glycosyltransferase involved in cell wall biosynthesis
MSDISDLQVGFFVRTDQANKGGGDLVQATGYTRALRKRGVAARLISKGDELKGLRLLHVFNLDRPWDCLPLVRQARRLRCTIVLSPIAHPRAHVRRYQAERSFWWEQLLVRSGVGGDFSERLKALARSVGSSNAAVGVEAVRRSVGSARCELWALSAGCQLLSQAEQKELLEQGLAFEGKATELVRNGVDLAAGDLPMEPAEITEFIRQNPRYGVVGGRIEPRKNQLEVVRLASGLGIPLIFAGQLNHRHRQYCRDFKRSVAGQAQMLYAGGVSREVFAQLLKHAQLHVSASLFEVSPLVDLEARALGCRVVATRASLGTEFLDDYAELCDPWSADSIKTAIAKAWTAQEPAPPMPVPSWDDTADPLLKLYRAAMAAESHG